MFLKSVPVARVKLDKMYKISLLIHSNYIYMIYSLKITIYNLLVAKI